MTMDVLGNLYCTGGPRVVVFAPDGDFPGNVPCDTRCRKVSQIRKSKVSFDPGASVSTMQI